MFSKIGEAIRLLLRHAVLLSAIILTVWLPGNLLLNLLAYRADEGGELLILKLTMWIEAIFGPIYIGAMIFALARIKKGQAVSYGEAIGVGFRNWGALFLARLVAGVIILLGLIALVVPGIMLVVRYALLEPAVVLENAGTSQSRWRSTQLTEGRRWPIFGAGLICFAGFMLLSFVVYLPLGFSDSPKLMPLEVALDCLLDVAYAVVQITMFLFYWEASGAGAPPLPPLCSDPAPNQDESESGS